MLIIEKMQPLDLSEINVLNQIKSNQISPKSNKLNYIKFNNH